MTKGRIELKSAETTEREVRDEGDGPKNGKKKEEETQRGRRRRSVELEITPKDRKNQNAAALTQSRCDRLLQTAQKIKQNNKKTTHLAAGLSLSRFLPNHGSQSLPLPGEVNS